MSALWLEHRVVLSGAHVIPLSQRETGDRVCDRRRRWTRSSRARACCLRRRARHSSSVEMCVCSQLRMAALGCWGLYYFSHEKLHTFPPRHPDWPLGLECSSLPFVASDWRLFEHPFQFPTYICFPAWSTFWFHAPREVCWEYSEDDGNSVTVTPSVPWLYFVTLSFEPLMESVISSSDIPLK